MLGTSTSHPVVVEKEPGEEVYGTIIVSSLALGNTFPENTSEAGSRLPAMVIPQAVPVSHGMHPLNEGHIKIISN